MDRFGGQPPSHASWLGGGSSSCRAINVWTAVWTTFFPTISLLFMTTTTPTFSVDVGDYRFDVHAEVASSGTAGRTVALLLHGFPQSAASWSAVAQRLTAFGIASYAPNQRGYSPGARPAAVDAYRLAELTGDIIGLCDALGLERVHLVGHDWGAIVAWSVAAAYSTRVASLTAVSVPHPAAFAQAMRSDPEQIEKSRYMALLEEPGSEEMLLADAAAALRIGFGAAVPREIAQSHIEVLSQPGAMTAALNWYRAKGQDWQEISAVRVPSTFVWGTDDIAVSRWAAERCVRHVDAPYEFLALDGVGHWIPEEVPDRLSAAIVHRIVSAHGD
ncbi:alpha/beta fold hydrolase [Nocardia abscessus]|uniref:alpha/beta fold hydrolase n=1 Tax=Nocardia abscessus TaxID=120957 RepID=UPI00245851BB|nr:alpha/beta hydrolase [Nocardia abscessus]